MTTRTRCALNRVRNHARSLGRAVDALGPQDDNAMPWGAAARVALTAHFAKVVDRKLTDLLDHGEPPARKAPVRITSSDTVDHGGQP
mgnify:CR=1 FL=1